MNNDNLTQAILEEISEDTTGMEHTRREAEKLDNEGVDPKEYEQAYRTVESKAEELERPLEEKTDTIEALVNAFDSMQDSREFKDEMQEGLVDAEKVETMVDIIEEFRDILPRLLLTTRLWENLADEQHKIVDTAQLARDQSTIEQYIKESTNSMKEAMQEISKTNQKQVEDAREFYENRVGRASDNLEEIIQNQKNIGRVLEEQTKVLQQLNHSIDDTGDISQQNKVNNGSTGSSDFSTVQNEEDEEETESIEVSTSDDSEAEEKSLKPVSDLSGNKKEFVELYRKHGEDWTNQFYADELDLKENTIDSYKSQLANDGYIDT